MTFSDWRDLAKAVWRREQGQTMPEYGVILAVITIGAVAVFTTLSLTVSGVVSRIAGLIPGAG